MDSTTIDNKRLSKPRSGKSGVRVEFQKREKENVNKNEQPSPKSKNDGKEKHKVKHEKLRSGSCVAVETTAE